LSCGLYFLIHRNLYLSYLIQRRAPLSTLFPYTTLFRSGLSSKPLSVITCRIWSINDTRRSPRRSASLWTQSCTPSRSSRGLTARSEEHTSELQSRGHLVCRLLRAKKKFGY